MEKIISIGGMHCENCKAAAERRINRMDGALCKVNLSKKTALIKLSRNISDEELTEAITALDFTVEKIVTREV